MGIIHVAGEKTFLDFAGLTLTIFPGPDITTQVQVFVAAPGRVESAIRRGASQSGPGLVNFRQRAGPSLLLRVSQFQVLDNLKSAVTTLDRDEPIPNATYA